MRCQNIYIISHYKSMGKLAGVLVLIANLLLVSHSLVPNRKSALIQSAQGVQISPNQLIAAAYNATHLCVYNAITGALLTLNKTLSPTVSLQFSSSSRQLAVSDTQGNTYFPKIAHNQDVSYHSIKRYQYATNKGTESIIADTCWTAGDEYLVIVHTDGVIVVSTLAGLAATGYTDSLKPAKVACSPSTPAQFVIGGSSNNTENKIALELFRIKSETLSIESQLISLDATNLTRVNHIKIGKDDELYIVGDSSNVYSYSPPLYNMSVLYEGKGQLFKVELTNNHQILAVVNQTHLVVQDNTTANQLQSTSSYRTDARLFSLAAGGTRVLYVDVSGSAEYLSKCAQGQFFNATSDNCVKCNSGCSICQANSNTCYECSPAHFLSESTCTKCGQYCSACTSEKKCSKCEDPFILHEEGQCGCQKGYRIIDDTCKRGIEVWLFAVVVGGATLSLCLIAIVNIVIMRKRERERQQNLLRNDNED